MAPFDSTKYKICVNIGPSNVLALEGCGHPERTQPDHDQHGREDVQLEPRHVGGSAGDTGATAQTVKGRGTEIHFNIRFGQIKNLQILPVFGNFISQTRWKNKEFRFSPSNYAF